MSALQLVDNCSAQRYCTAENQALAYGNQFIVQWNNMYPPLNTESGVTVSVYSSYDLTKPVFTRTNVPNLNGSYALTPEPVWFSRYNGSNNEDGRDQQIYLAVYLQGNDPPAASTMLPLQLTATPEQYADILNILHPPSTTATTESPSKSAESSAESFASSVSSVSSKSSETASPTSSATDTASSPTLAMESISPSPSSSETDLGTDTHARSGLSGGAIAGIVVGSVVGLLLLILLLLLPMYRRRQRRNRMLTKSLGSQPPPMSSVSSTNMVPGGGSDAAVAATAGVIAGAALADKMRPNSASPSDTPLLLGGRPNNSFNSPEGSLVDSQLSPKTAVYHPLSLESPRVMMNMPASTRSASASKPVASPDPILSSDDARQIGDIFRDALRKPPPVSEDGTSESPGQRDSILMHMDDELEEEEDPGWRERVAGERMQRELEQEASVIRSVAMRAHGSDYSSSRPGTSQSNSSHPN
ncbi:hypothetical protein GGH96_005707 [Coemansia sp. RSA 1972]|nr:hypothetical protein GGH96_005707 [Coemansia sp. RSA 1972]